MAVLRGLVRAEERLLHAGPLPLRGHRDELYIERSSRKIDSRRLFTREYDVPKTFSLAENQFSGKTHFHTIASRPRLPHRHRRQHPRARRGQPARGTGHRQPQRVLVSVSFSPEEVRCELRWSSGQLTRRTRPVQPVKFMTCPVLNFGKF